jgi:hypothetical protein
MEELLWNFETSWLQIGWKKYLWSNFFQWDSYEKLLSIGKLRIWFIKFRKKS